MAATGSLADIQGRLRSVLPNNWFPNGPLPILDTVLSGIASALSTAYGQIANIATQMRLATSTGGMLDIFAYDFFGQWLLRRPSEGDTPYQNRISATLFAPLNTRAAMVEALTNLTGVAPQIFEPFLPTDTGGYFDPSRPTKGTGLGYGTVGFVSVGPFGPFWGGGYGSLLLPAQCFIQVQVPTIGISDPISGYGGWLGGYGVGRIEYLDVAEISGPITDQDIYNTINRTKAAGVICWTQIEA